MSEHECVCGFESDSPQGIAAHQRHCEEHQDEDSPDSDVAPATVSTGSEGPEAEKIEAGDDYPRSGDDSQEDAFDFEGVEADVFERDDEQCRRCGDSRPPLVVAKIDEDGDERPANLVTLCEECDDELAGVNRRSKRTEIYG